MHADTPLLARRHRTTTFIPGKPAGSNACRHQFCTIRLKLTQNCWEIGVFTSCIAILNLCWTNFRRLVRCRSPLKLLIHRYIFPTNTVRPLTLSDVVEIIWSKTFYKSNVIVCKWGLTLGVTAWIYVGAETADRFSALCDFWTELLITITMAVAARAPLSGKLPTHPESRDSEAASPNWPLCFGHGAWGAAPCQGACPAARWANTDVQVLQDRAEWWCLSFVQELVHQSAHTNGADVWISAVSPGIEDDRAKQFISPTLTNSNFFCVFCYLNLKDAQLFSATPFWFLYESHSDWSIALLHFLGNNISECAAS